MAGNSPEQVVYSVGHSNQSIEQFLNLLQTHRIEVLVDVRSAPYSRFASQFNKPDLERAVVDAGLRYVYMGQELGGRPADESLYDVEGHADYQRISETVEFAEGIERLKIGLSRGLTIALMCSEEDPSDCHRRLLIGTVLQRDGIEVQHIRGDGHIDHEGALPQTVLERPQQIGLFDDSTQQGRAAWRSTQSVLPRRPPSSSSGF